MELYKEKEWICRELGLRSDLGVALGNQGMILRDRGDLDDAMVLYKEAEWILRETNNSYGLAVVLLNEAILLADDMDDPNSALPLIEEAYSIATSCGLKELAEGIQPILEWIRRMAGR